MKFLKHIFFIALILFSNNLLTNCKQEKKEGNILEATKQLVISDTLKWSERMALSIIKRNPEAWDIDHIPEPKWEYKVGLVLTAYERLYAKTKNEKYYNYIKDFVDMMIDSTGTIKGYELESYNIDLINSGKLLFNLYDKTKDERYLKALKLLRSQLDGHPRTASNGFWHKNIYPNQMWLDGLYMGEPFYARYTMEFEEGENLNDIAHQFKLLHDKTFDKNTGLYFHAWDESKKMPWANKETGCAPNIWLRALGWYAMALVDVLDYMPKEHPKHEQLVHYLNELAEAVSDFQDASGLWYQVPNMQDREGNYLESSGSSMFAYAFAKGAHKGYLPAKFEDIANKAFDGLIKERIEIDEDGEIHLTKTCKSAGLGGNPYRDGSYEYYLSEPILTDNSHGLGPFIMAATELNR
ncbi:glycoside hydrolase family 88 protein [Mariniflexile litorale]|uniref:Glycoside hydrolase family 88 protein n=1 Tax=Mariniflexile litorale TaxID=3045158 RepID=A0AAU7EKQ1_9FLAO|nr:glycoside hydrolase family 88 protein [Mariniflexile sp. KMM 9835]MDQ8210661.1 glycoside hydrolase family 88 protein [Mariniflexile sp. KMM 9835]